MLSADSIKGIKKFMVPALLVVCFLVLLSTGVPTAKAEESEKRLISITGEAEMYVKPDVASASFGVETNASTAQEAQKLNSSAMNRVISVLKGKGIAEADIQTSNFSMRPVYEQQGEKPYAQQINVTGYRCSNTVTVRIKNISNVGSIIDAVIGAGATNVNGISFGVLDSKKHEDEMLARAVENARHKADIMAKAAGVNITGIFKMSDGWVSFSTNHNGVKRMADYSEAAPIEPGEVSIIGTVRIDFTF